MKKSILLSGLLSSISLTGCYDFNTFYYEDGEYPFELREHPKESQSKTLIKRDLSAIHRDESLTYQAIKKIQSFNKNNNKVRVTVLNGHILVTGHVKDKASRDQINSALKSIPGVKKVSNRSSVSKSKKSSGSWMKVKVRTKLMKDSSVNSSNIKITTDDDTVYLMGTGSQKDKENATKSVKEIEGVKNVINLME